MDQLSGANEFGFVMFKDVFTVHGEFEFHSCEVNLEMTMKHLKFVCMHQKKLFTNASETLSLESFISDMQLIKFQLQFWPPVVVKPGYLRSDDYCAVFCLVIADSFCLLARSFSLRLHLH